MKPGILLTALVAAPVAVASALIASTLLAPAASPAARRPLAAAPVSTDDESDLRATLERQAQELEFLRERIALLESRPAAQRLPLQDAPATDGVAASAMPVAPAADEFSATFVANVDVALQQIREEERREEEAQRYARQLERIDQRLERLTERIGLSPYQVDEVRDVLRKHEARDTELRALRDEIDDRDQYREQRRTFEAETRAALATILTPEQMEGYERSEERGNDRGANRGNGGNGGGDTQRRERGNDRGQRNG